MRTTWEDFQGGEEGGNDAIVFNQIKTNLLMYPKDLHTKGLVASCCCLNMIFSSLGSCVWTVALQLLELF